MADKVSPHWLKLGSQIRLMRESQGFSQAQLSRALSVSPAMLSAVERGTRGCKPDLAEQIDRALNTGGKVRRLWEANHASSAFPDWFRDIVQLQRAASEIWAYQISLIPGLLQSEGYARTRVRLAQRTASEEEVDQRVTARLDRQAPLTSARPPLLVAVLDEAALVRPVGGREVMARQLDHLLEMSRRPNVMIYVVPMSTEFHPELMAGFQMITIPDRGQVLYLETRISGTPLDTPKELNHYAHLFGELRGVALPPDASRGLIERIRGEFQ